MLFHSWRKEIRKMKRCILVSNRQNKDEKTGDELLFLTLYRLPNKMKNDGLWFPKQNEAIINACVNKTRSPEDYEKFKQVLPGAIIDVTFGLNDFNNKTFVAKLDLIENSLFDAELIYQ